MTWIAIRGQVRFLTGLVIVLIGLFIFEDWARTTCLQRLDNEINNLNNEQNKSLFKISDVTNEALEMIDQKSKAQEKDFFDLMDKKKDDQEQRFMSIINRIDNTIMPSCLKGGSTRR